MTRAWLVAGCVSFSELGVEQPWVLESSCNLQRQERDKWRRKVFFLPSLLLLFSGGQLYKEGCFPSFG